MRLNWCLLHALLLLLCPTLLAQTTKEFCWSLPAINGHAPNVWSKDANNWTWQSGNPLSRDGATWTLGIQNKNNPSPTDPYDLMKQGKAWNYNFVWRDRLAKSDPHFYYLEKTLAAKAQNGPSESPASVIVFTPADAGTCRVVIAGKATVTSKTAGHCRLQIILISDAGRQSEVLKSLELNSPGGHGDFPQTFKWESKVTFANDTNLMVRVQTISPGPAPAGKSVVTFQQFDVIGQTPQTQSRQTIHYDMKMDQDALAQWEIPDGVRLVIDSKAGKKNKPAMVLTFDKPIRQPVIIYGPEIQVGEAPSFATGRQLGVTLHAKAHDMTDDAFEVRAMAGNHWLKAVSPHRTFDTIIHLMQRHAWEEWTKESESGHLPDATTQARLCFRVSSPTGKGKIVIDQLTVSQQYTVNHLIQSEQLGHVFHDTQGRLSIKPAYPDQLLAGRVQLHDELDQLIDEKHIQPGMNNLEIDLPTLGYYQISVDASYQDGQQIQTQTRAAVIGLQLDESVRQKSRYGVMRVHGSEDWAVKTGARMDWGFWKINHMTLDAAGQPQVSGNSGWPSKMFRLWAMNGTLPTWLEPPHVKHDHGLYPPRDWGLFEKTIETWAKACNPLPDVVTVYNEPDAHWRGTKQELVRYVQTFTRAVRRARPEAVIGGPGFYSIRMDDFKEYAQMGILDGLDCLVIHAYVNGTAPEGDFIQRITELKQYMQSTGKDDMPIYLTEFGWTTPPGDWQTPVDEITKARYCARSLILTTALDIDGLVYFCGRYAKAGKGTSYAMVHADYTPTPTYSAFTTLLKQMSTIRDGGQWLKLSPSVNWVGFKRQDQYLVAAWDTAGESTLQLPHQPLQMVDMCGRNVPVNSHSVTLSPSPIYLVFSENPLTNMVSHESKRLMPGSILPIEFDGCMLPAPIKTVGSKLVISETAPLGEYQLLIRNKQSWINQPVTVCGPVSMTVESSQGKSDQLLPEIEINIVSLASQAVDARLTFNVPGLDLPAQTIELKAGQTSQHAVALHFIELGKRYQGTVELAIDSPIRWQVSEPIDVTFVQCLMINSSSTEVNWQQVKAVDLSDWGPWPGSIATTDCSASLKMLATPDGLHLQVDVHDDEHVANLLEDAIWKEDSIQVAFDVDAEKPWQPNNVGNGLNGHRISEFGLALPTENAPVVWCWRAYVPGLRQGLHETLMRQVHITRDSKSRITSYVCQFPWKILGLDACPESGTEIGFSMVVNDKDTKVPRRALRIFNGILDGKDPAGFGKIKLVAYPNK